MKHFYPREESSVPQYAMQTPARASRNVMDRSRKLRAKKVLFSSLCCLVSRFVSFRGESRLLERPLYVRCNLVELRSVIMRCYLVLLTFSYFIRAPEMQPTSCRPYESLFVSTPPDDPMKKKHENVLQSSTVSFHFLRLI